MQTKFGLTNNTKLNGQWLSITAKVSPGVPTTFVGRTENAETSAPSSLLSRRPRALLPACKLFVRASKIHVQGIQRTPLTRLHLRYTLALPVQ